MYMYIYTHIYIYIHIFRYTFMKYKGTGKLTFVDGTILKVPAEGRGTKNDDGTMSRRFDRFTSRLLPTRFHDWATEERSKKFERSPQTVTSKYRRVQKCIPDTSANRCVFLKEQQETDARRRHRPQGTSLPPWRQPRGKLMVSLVNLHTMPPESGGICGRLTQDLPLDYLQGDFTRGTPHYQSTPTVYVYVVSV